MKAVDLHTKALPCSSVENLSCNLPDLSAVPTSPADKCINSFVRRDEKEQPSCLTVIKDQNYNKSAILDDTNEQVPSYDLPDFFDLPDLSVVSTSQTDKTFIPHVRTNKNGRASFLTAKKDSSNGKSIQNNVNEKVSSYDQPDISVLPSSQADERRSHSSLTASNYQTGDNCLFQNVTGQVPSYDLPDLNNLPDDSSTATSQAYKAFSGFDRTSKNKKPSFQKVKDCNKRTFLQSKTSKQVSSYALPDISALPTYQSSESISTLTRVTNTNLNDNLNSVPHDTFEKVPSCDYLDSDNLPGDSSIASSQADETFSSLVRSKEKRETPLKVNKDDDKDKKTLSRDICKQVPFYEIPDIFDHVEDSSIATSQAYEASSIIVRTDEKKEAFSLTGCKDQNNDISPPSNGNTQVSYHKHCQEKNKNSRPTKIYKKKVSSHLKSNRKIIEKLYKTSEKDLPMLEDLKLTESSSKPIVSDTEHLEFKDSNVPDIHAQKLDSADTEKFILLVEDQVVLDLGNDSEDGWEVQIATSKNSKSSKKRLLSNYLRKNDEKVLSKERNNYHPKEFTVQLTNLKMLSKEELKILGVRNFKHLLRNCEKGGGDKDTSSSSRKSSAFKETIDLLSSECKGTSLSSVHLNEVNSDLDEVNSDFRNRRKLEEFGSSPNKSSSHSKSFNKSKVNKPRFDYRNYKVHRCKVKNCELQEKCVDYHSAYDRRRDPKKHIYSPALCKKFDSTGKCLKGDSCGLSHSKIEVNYHPDFYKKYPCKFKFRSKCPKGVFCEDKHDPPITPKCVPRPAVSSSSKKNVQETIKEDYKGVTSQKSTSDEMLQKFHGPSRKEDLMNIEDCVKDFVEDINTSSSYSDISYKKRCTSSKQSVSSSSVPVIKKRILPFDVHNLCIEDKYLQKYLIKLMKIRGLFGDGLDDFISLLHSRVVVGGMSRGRLIESLASREGCVLLSNVCETLSVFTKTTFDENHRNVLECLKMIKRLHKEVADVFNKNRFYGLDVYVIARETMGLVEEDIVNHVKNLLVRIGKVNVEMSLILEICKKVRLLHWRMSQYHPTTERSCNAEIVKGDLVAQSAVPSVNAISVSEEQTGIQVVGDVRNEIAQRIQDSIRSTNEKRNFDSETVITNKDASKNVPFLEHEAAKTLIPNLCNTSNSSIIHRRMSQNHPTTERNSSAEMIKTNSLVESAVPGINVISESEKLIRIQGDRNIRNEIAHRIQDILRSANEKRNFDSETVITNKSTSKNVPFSEHEVTKIHTPDLSTTSQSSMGHESKHLDMCVVSPSTMSWEFDQNNSEFEKTSDEKNRAHLDYLQHFQTTMEFSDNDVINGVEINKIVKEVVPTTVNYTMPELYNYVEHLFKYLSVPINKKLVNLICRKVAHCHLGLNAARTAENLNLKCDKQVNNSATSDQECEKSYSREENLESSNKPMLLTCDKLDNVFIGKNAGNPSLSELRIPLNLPSFQKDMFKNSDNTLERESSFGPMRKPQFSEREILQGMEWEMPEVSEPRKNASPILLEDSPGLDKLPSPAGDREPENITLFPRVIKSPSYSPECAVLKFSKRSPELEVCAFVSSSKRENSRYERSILNSKKIKRKAESPPPMILESKKTREKETHYIDLLSSPE